MQDSMKVLMPLQNTAKRLCVVAHGEICQVFFVFNLDIHVCTLKFGDYNATQL